MLTVSAFYLEKQNKKIFLKNLLGRCQYQNKKTLFTDPIFSEGIGYSSEDSTTTFLAKLFNEEQAPPI